MASGKLPWELEEEILSRLPPRSLVRLRSVCKHWNDLFNDKRFVNNNLARARPQFIILTESKMYSIDTIGLGGVDPTIEVNELASELHFEAKKSTYTRITACDGILFRHFWMQGVTIWNPCLRQVGLIEYEYEDRDFHLLGVGYDTTKPEKGYKILGYFDRLRRVTDACQEGHLRFAIYECASHSFKFIDSLDWPMLAGLGEYVSLNGNLYWTSYNKETRECFLGSFDFSTEISMRFCLPPCGKHVSGSLHKLVLTVFKGDRFALLKQSRISRNTEVWVTKEKINNSNKDDVVWLNLMTLSIPNFPSLFNQFSGIRYFIYDKTLIMCCGADQTGVPCIFIARGDMCKKIQIANTGAGDVHWEGLDEEIEDKEEVSLDQGQWMPNLKTGETGAACIYMVRGGMYVQEDSD
ncbi:unnamed protein product [Arabidopsis lyrata]|nr:unnamed protein product [Arabidopsis lyrata]